MPSMARLFYSLMEGPHVEEKFSTIALDSIFKKVIVLLSENKFYGGWHIWVNPGSGGGRWSSVHSRFCTRRWSFSTKKGLMTHQLRKLQKQQT